MLKARLRFHPLNNNSEFSNSFMGYSGMEEEKACMGWCVFCLCVCFFHVKSTENCKYVKHASFFFFFPLKRVTSPKENNRTDKLADVVNTLLMLSFVGLAGL